MLGSVFAMAAIRHQANQPAPKKTASAAKQKNQTFFRCSIQEIRGIAQRLARKPIRPAYVIAWSLWRRAHQAAEQNAQFKIKSRM
jgi:hypothetical protein